MSESDAPTPHETALLNRYHERVNRRLERSWRFGVLMHAGDRLAAMNYVYDMDRSSLSDAEARTLAQAAADVRKGWIDARRAWVEWWRDNA